LLRKLFVLHRRQLAPTAEHREGGKVTEASHDSTITLGAFVPGDWENYRGHPAVNNISTVKWKVKLGAGESFKPAVKYEYFTRS
jgi:hypothetical protein